MCGIVGVVGRHAPAYRERLGAAVDVLAHRGPDDRGTLEAPAALLGHRRLAIIDLSSAGRQPMVDPVSGTAIVYNGEIYNYVELRRELEALGHVFRTRTDIEVLLKSLVQWGPDALGRLNGMWAFGWWRPSERKLLLARDRFGVKPLYYTLRDGIAFASEPKALLVLHPELRRPDTEVLHDFLAYGNLYGRGRAFYEGMSVLPPAHVAEYGADTDTLRTWRYWDYPEREGAPSSPQEDEEQFAELFDEAVRLRLRSDVPVGVSLSGGLDSTAVLSAAVGQGARAPALFTSTYGASGEGEAPWARRAASAVGLEPILVPAHRDGWLETMQCIAWHMDAPGYSPAVYPLWFLMREARERGVPVVLEGQGADEALAGYAQYAALRLLDALRRPSARRLEGLPAEVRGFARTFSPFLLASFVLREASPGLLAGYRRRLGSHTVLRPGPGAEPRPPERVPVTGTATRDAVGRRLLLDHARDVLPGLLHYGDAVSMAHSVESRQPFLDYRLVDWVFERTTETKLRGGQTKWPVRAYLRGHGQAAIADRSDKLGYPTPVERWLAERGGALARELLLEPGARLADHTERKALERWLDRATRFGGSFATRNHVYRLVSTELWLRAIHAGPLRSPAQPAAARA